MRLNESCRDWVLLNDLVIPNGRAETQIDHVLIGDKEVYCIETKDITGKFYPHRNGWLWYPYHARGTVRKKTVVKNPQHQSIYHADHLRGFLDRNGFQIPVKPVVILTHPHGEWKGKQDQHCPVLRINGFLQSVNKVPDGEIRDHEKQELTELLLDADERHGASFYAKFGSDGAQ